jgi:hypothetical protein
MAWVCFAPHLIVILGEFSGDLEAQRVRVTGKGREMGEATGKFGK